jgi:hypothetical protein
MGPTRPEPVLDRLRALEQDLIETENLLEVLPVAGLLERLGATRAEVLAIGLALARAEFVAICQQCDSAQGEPADIVQLVSYLPGG